MQIDKGSLHKLLIILILVGKDRIVMPLYSLGVSTKLSGTDMVFRMFRNSGHSWMICCMFKSTRHLLYMGAGLKSYDQFLLLLKKLPKIFEVLRMYYLFIMKNTG